MQVVFFQRIFAHYQAGLVKELAFRSEHTYRFFGADSDPLQSGIEPIPDQLRRQVAFTECRTTHWSKYLAFQWRAVGEAMISKADTMIFEGSFTILTNWLAIVIAKMRGKRVLLYSHGWLRREKGLKGFVRNTFYRLSDALLLYGHRARQIGMEAGFSPNRLYVVYNSLNEEEMQVWRERLTSELCTKFRLEWFGVASERSLIVSAGRLTAAKQYTTLIDAAALLKLSGKAINIMLVGDGPERCRLEQHAAQKGINLVLPGSSYDEEFLSVCFASADVTVIPGAAGLSVIHSLSYGTPVIVHDDFDKQGPESEAVQEGVNGGLFRAGDAADLAAAIQRVLRELPRSHQTASQCRAIIDEAYCPTKRRQVFDAAVAGRQAT